MIDDLAPLLQTAQGAALLGDPGLVDLVAATPDGPAIFAPNQPYADLFNRITLEAPQILPTPDDGGCGSGTLAYLTTHCWAQGPDATLAAGRLGGFVRRILNTRLDLGPGLRVTAHGFVSARPVGDPDPTIEHVVVLHQFNVRPTA